MHIATRPILACTSSFSSRYVPALHNSVHFGFESLHAALSLYHYTHTRAHVPLPPTLGLLQYCVGRFVHSLVELVQSAPDFMHGSVDFPKLFYGTLILFITRCTIKAALLCCWAPYYLAQGIQALQDPSLTDGCNSPVMQPMIHALSSSATFEDMCTFHEKNRAFDYAYRYREASCALTGEPELGETPGSLVRRFTELYQDQHY